MLLTVFRVRQASLRTNLLDVDVNDTTKVSVVSWVVVVVNPVVVVTLYINDQSARRKNMRATDKRRAHRNQ